MRKQKQKLLIKNTYFYCGIHNDQMEYLINAFKNNGIEIYGITPYLMNREKEIFEYLRKHSEISQYCIIDDAFYFESMKEHMVKLTFQWHGGQVLKEINKNNIIEILNKPFCDGDRLKHNNYNINEIYNNGEDTKEKNLY